MTPQSEASKKRMEVASDGHAGVKRYVNHTGVLCFKSKDIGYILDNPRQKISDFESGYQAGMQDPEANSERIKQLEGLLGECEKSLEVILYNNHASTLKFSDVAYKTLWKLQKLKAAKEGKL